MKLVYFFTLLAGLVGQAYATCLCTTFSKAAIFSQSDYSVLIYPRDNITDMPCNPVRCVYTIQTTQFDGISGNVYYLRNFQKSKATLKFYNGKDLSAAPYFKFDKNTENSELTVTPSSSARIVTIVLDINPALTENLPTFILYVIGKAPPTTTTTTIAPTTSAPDLTTSTTKDVTTTLESSGTTTETSNSTDETSSATNETSSATNDVSSTTTEVLTTTVQTSSTTADISSTAQTTSITTEATASEATTESTASEATTKSTSSEATTEVTASETTTETTTF